MLGAFFHPQDAVAAGGRNSGLGKIHRDHCEQHSGGAIAAEVARHQRTGVRAVGGVHSARYDHAGSCVRFLCLICCMYVCISVCIYVHMFFLLEHNLRDCTRLEIAVHVRTCTPTDILKHKSCVCAYART
jgi:hypothetical protein